MELSTQPDESVNQDKDGKVPELGRYEMRKLAISVGFPYQTPSLQARLSKKICMQGTSPEDTTSMVFGFVRGVVSRRLTFSLL